MKSRIEIKTLAKEAISEQRAVSILIPLLLVLISSAGGTLGVIPYWRTMPYLGILLSIASIAFSCIVTVLFVNQCGSFVKIYDRNIITIGDPFSNLKINFLRKLGGSLWMSLWIFLWMLLLVIPGIVKGYAYSMTPFILSSCPNVKATDALKLSMRMTYGYKGKLFVMHLSFIGWFLLGMLTFGILLFIYVIPYMGATMAGYYNELRDQALASGKIQAEELN